MTKIKQKRKENKKEVKEKSRIDIMALIGLIISFLGLFISLWGIYLNYLIRKDTEELAKFNDRPVYYTIDLYPTDDTKNSIIHDNYLSLDLKLIVNAFEIYKKDFLNVNYNAVFTKIKYYMVYDYSKKEKNYKYMRYTLDDKTMAQLRLEDNYYAAPVKMNYSFTPNKKYCYLLIYTETLNDKNLDLIFFNYYDSNETFKIDTITEDGVEKVDIKRIDYDAFICQDYFVDLWSNSDDDVDDVKYMFDVYKDLYTKLINSI